MEIVKILDTWGFCYIHLDHGCYEVWNKAIPSAYDEPGSQLFIAERMRKEGITTPFLVQGKLNYGPLAEQVVESGIADMIAMGHQSLADPYWPNKVQAGRLDDVVYCTACNECLNSAVRFPGSCAINPRSCKETKYVVEPSKSPRKILVVGGGPGGMYTAALAAEMGHDVTLWEKDGKLGGLVNAAGAPTFKVDMSPNMKLGLKARLNSAHIQIHTYAKMVDIEPREVVVETSQGIIPITCDNVVLASGFKANHALADALANKPYPVFLIGDCVKPGKVYDAVHGGFHALRKLG